MSSFPKLFLVLIFFYSITSNSQQRWKAEFGEPTLTEFAMERYEIDTTANAVVVFESGENHVEIINGFIRLVKEVHCKIKVFDKDKFEHSIVEIPLYNTKNRSEKVTKLKAVTHNGNLKTYVTDDAIFTVKDGEHWSRKRFTFPNIRNGSILEYNYRIETPFFFNFGDWEFQGDLPKIYSEFYGEIPGNFRYNRALYGGRKLYLNDASVKKHCFSIPSSSNTAHCEVLMYAMKDVPAFKEEKHMLAPKNYLSRISFELQEYTDFEGSKTKYSKEWKDVDREFKNDKDLGRQLGSKGYFEDKLPADIHSISNPLDKAKAIFSFIQNHFTWDGYYRIFSEIHVKKAFDAKTGNIAEINIALINSLNAAGLDAKLVLLPTREAGLPTLLYPVLTDFNYVLAMLTIDEKKYFLDATDKFTAFDILPFRTLNVQGRVMDFKKGSYWHPIEPYTKNVHYVNAQIKANEDDVFYGKVQEIYSGYVGVEQRKGIQKRSMKTYANSKVSGAEGLELIDFQIENMPKVDEALKETYTAQIETEMVGDNVYFYPFFMTPHFKENPFTEEDRQFPIDFGYPITNTYLVSANLNNLYEVVELPKSRAFKIPDGIGECSVIYTEANGSINLRLQVILNEYRFDAENYTVLKEFFSNVVTMQSKEPIVLKRI